MSEQMSKSKILDAAWFTPLTGECIGVVSVETEIGERKVYIGVGQGRDEGADARKIADYGTPFILPGFMGGSK